MVTDAAKKNAEDVRTAMLKGELTSSVELKHNTGKVDPAGKAFRPSSSSR
jgi:hypothetical protein